ncbi:MAG: hypothetical protein ACOCUU_01470 [Nanoarchaeota archaeon]
MLNKKRGTFAVGFTIKVILAIVCIGFLMYLGVKLYGTFERKTDLQQAEVQLEKIVRVIERLEEGETANILIEGPRDWGLFLIEDKICFCENVEKFKSGRTTGGSDDYFKECQESLGTCSSFKDINLFLETGDVIDPKYVSLKTIPREIFILKEDNLRIYANEKLFNNREGFNLKPIDKGDTEKEEYKWDDFLNSNIEVVKEGKELTTSIKEILPYVVEHDLKDEGTGGIHNPIAKKANEIYGDAFDRNALCIKIIKEGKVYPSFKIDGDGNACKQRIYSRYTERISYNKGDIKEYSNKEGVIKIIFEISEKT